MTYGLFIRYPRGFICLTCGSLIVFCMDCGRALCLCTDWSGGYDDLYWCKDGEHPED